MHSGKIQVNANESGFGAEIKGVTLAEPLNETDKETILQAWYQHSVVYFPDQELNHDQLEAFTESIGDYGLDPFIKPLADHPHILELKREAEEKAQNFGAAWHSDWSFQEFPPSATILHSKVIPPVGGDTLFSDGYRAYETLSPIMQNMLAELNCVHSAALAYSPKGVLAAEENKRTMDIIFSEEAEETQVHPMVRTHPKSGRKSLYINPVYTTGIEGMNSEESFFLLSFLYQHMSKEEFIYRHKWQANMLTMWDNRCCNHLAEGGYDGHLRVLHRTTVKGEKPVR